MAITRLTVQQAAQQAPYLFIAPFAESSGTTTAVRTIESGSNVSVLPTNTPPIGTETGVWTTRANYFTPFNNAAENADNFLEWRRVTSVAAADWFQNLMHLDSSRTAKAISYPDLHLVMGGRIFYTGDTGGTGQLINGNMGSNTGGGVGAAFNQGDKVVATARNTGAGVTNQSQNGTFTSMMANSIDDEGVPGLGGVSEYAFSWLVHYDMKTMQRLVYVNGVLSIPGGGGYPRYPYQFDPTKDPTVDMTDGFALLTNINSAGTTSELFNDSLGGNNAGVAQMFAMRVEDESSAWVPELANQAFKTFSIETVLGV